MDPIKLLRDDFQTYHAAVLSHVHAFHYLDECLESVMDTASQANAGRNEYRITEIDRSLFQWLTGNAVNVSA
jgi:hypothetical protein